MILQEPNTRNWDGHDPGRLEALGAGQHGEQDQQSGSGFQGALQKADGTSRIIF